MHAFITHHRMYLISLTAGMVFGIFGSGSGLIMTPAIITFFATLIGLMTIACKWPLPALLQLVFLVFQHAYK